MVLRIILQESAKMPENTSALDQGPSGPYFLGPGPEPGPGK